MKQLGLGLFIASLFLGTVHASTQDPRDSDSPFGVLEFFAWGHDWNNYHYDPDKIAKAADLMKEAGVSFVRMDFLRSDIEPAQGRYDFAKYDRIVDILTERGIKILGLLEYNPSWVTPWNHVPDAESYVWYARQVVGHYKGRIKYWEIWNEPDSAVYWVPQDDMRAYTALLKNIYRALKEVDPTCSVELGGLAATHSLRLKQIYKNGGGDSFDAVNIHPFVDPRSSNPMRSLKGAYLGLYKEMQKNGDEQKPIWFTEIGCPGVPKDRWDEKTRGWFLGTSGDEEEQARWVEKVYGEPLRWKSVQKIFWAFFRDTPGHFKSGVDYFGLVRSDFSKKPAFESYKKITASHNKGKVH